MPFGASRAGLMSVAEDDIPDSVESQWRREEFADPWPANVGDVDMSVSGLSKSTFSNGEDSVFGDGTDAHGLASGPETLATNETFGIAFTIQYPNPDQFDTFFGCTGDGQFFIRDPSGSGTIEIALQDSNSNNLNVETDNQYDDGNPHPIIINKRGNSASDIGFYVDDMTTEQSTTINNDQGFDHTNYNLSTDWAFWARNTDGTIDSNIEADMGVIELNSNPYSEEEREEFVSRRPEV